MTGPGRVLMTTDAVGGVWHQTLELARALGQEGVEIALAVLGPAPRSTQRADAERLANVSLYHAPFRLPWMSEPWNDVERAGDWLLDLADRTGSALAHLSEPALASRRWPIPTLAVGHSCVLSWHEAVRGTAAGPEWSRYARAMRRGFAAAGAVAAPTHAMLTALRRHYGVGDGIVVPNGRSASDYMPALKEEIVLTAGRLWDPAKNLGMLARVARKLSWTVAAAGDVHGPEGVWQAPDDGVVYLGDLPASALAAHMARAAVYALPARYEPFGLSILEAALSGCALVLGDIPSLREIWGGAALFVPPDDDHALFRALDGLTADRTLRLTLAMRSRERGLDFSPRRMARGYLAIYSNLGAAATRAPERVSTCAS